MRKGRVSQGGGDDIRSCYHCYNLSLEVNKALLQTYLEKRVNSSCICALEKLMKA